MKLPASLVAPKRGRIEIIPMIDAIFFLLVYFIMTSLSLTQMQTHGATLPQSRTASVKPSAKLVASVARNGDLFLDGSRVSERELVTRIGAKVAQNENIAVVLTGDKNADAAGLLRVFDLVKQADAKNVVFATEPATNTTTGEAAR
ncbi:MAG: biopolymer transporter ExbD [Armatimonadetes bacterium]|nr:biopolymer transporter ExbD [Armatimonadota bacterium]